MCAKDVRSIPTSGRRERRVSVSTNEGGREGSKASIPNTSPLHASSPEIGPNPGPRRSARESQGVLAVRSQPVSPLGKMQGDFAKLQGQRRLIPAEGPRISMGWIGLSLIQGAGRTSFHSREGRFRNSSATFTQLSSMSAAGLLSNIDAWPANVAD